MCFLIYKLRSGRCHFVTSNPHFCCSEAEKLSLWFIPDFHLFFPCQARIPGRQAWLCRAWGCCSSFDLPTQKSAPSLQGLLFFNFPMSPGWIWGQNLGFQMGTNWDFRFPLHALLCLCTDLAHNILNPQLVE